MRRLAHESNELLKDNAAVREVNAHLQN